MQARLQLASGELFVHCPFQPNIKDALKAIPNSRFDKRRKAWGYPLSPGAVTSLLELFDRFDLEPIGDTHALELRENQRPRQELKYLREPKPWSHQIEAAHKINSFALYFHGGMGVGKTRAVIDCVVNYDLRRVLVLCPSSVVLNWPDEFELFAGRPVKVIALPKKGTIAKRTERAKTQMEKLDVTGEIGVVVINYEAAWRDPFASWAKSRRWDLIVYDEIHKIKAPDGKISTWCGDMRAHVDRAVGLSGTIMPHGPLDVFGQYRALDPGIYGTSVTRFKIAYQCDFDMKFDSRAKPPADKLHAALENMTTFAATWGLRRGADKAPFPFDLSLAVQMMSIGFSDQEIVNSMIAHRRDIRHGRPLGRGHYIGVLATAKKMKGVPVTMYANLEDLRAKMDRIRFEVSRDVLDLPDAMSTRRFVELTPKELKVHNEIFEHLVSEIAEGEITASNALVRLLKLQQAVNGYAKTDDGELIEIGRSRRDALAELFDDIGVPGGEPVVCFCRFHPDLDAVHTAAAACGKEALELSGRRSEWQTWQKDHSSPPVLAVQIQAGGVGVNLTRARYNVFYSLGYSLGDYEQALARVHRPGQKRKVTHVHLVSKGTVDEHVYKALQDKADVVAYILKKLGEKVVNS
jgi:SNF2 family DNA or RNA helicase